MKLITVVNACTTIQGLTEKENLNAHLAYWLAKFIAKTQDEYKFFQTEMKKLIDKYGKVNEDGSVSVEPEKVEDFTKEVEALQDTEIEDPGIRFSLSELSAELKLSLKQMYPLLDFINEVE